MTILEITLGLPDLAMFTLIWLGIGIAIVICETPAAYRNKALRGYLNRKGRLPHVLVGEMAVVWGVVWWVPAAVELAGEGRR